MIGTSLQILNSAAMYCSFLRTLFCCISLLRVFAITVTLLTADHLELNQAKIIDFDSADTY